MKKFLAMEARQKKSIITFVLTTLFLLVMNLLSYNGLIGDNASSLIPLICVYIIFAISLNLVVGVLGELSLGHAGFICVGGYVGGLFSRMFEDNISSDYVRIILSFLVSLLVGALFGLLVGAIVLRLNGDYLAVVTLAFGEVVRKIFGELYVGMDDKGLHVSLISTSAIDNLGENAETFISGSLGLSKLVKSYRDFNKEGTITIIASVLTLVILLLILNYVNSESGRAVMAIRDNRIAAESMGINITKNRLMVYVFSSAVAAVGGAMYAYCVGSVNPNKYIYDFSIEILVIVVLGGLGSMGGAVIAAVVLTWLKNSSIFLNFSKYRMVIYAVVLIVMMIVKWNPQCHEFFKKISPRRFIKSFLQKKRTVKEGE